MAAKSAGSKKLPPRPRRSPLGPRFAPAGGPASGDPFTGGQAGFSIGLGPDVLAAAGVAPAAVPGLVAAAAASGRTPLF